MSHKSVYPLVRVPPEEYIEANKRKRQYWEERHEEWTLWECLEEIQREKFNGKNSFGRLRL